MGNNYVSLPGPTSRTMKTNWLLYIYSKNAIYFILPYNKPVK